MSKTDAMAPPIPEMMSKIKPVLPDLLCTRDQTAKPKAQLLSAPAANINDNTHP